jgi:hypothetical protein
LPVSRKPGRRALALIGGTLAVAGVTASVLILTQGGGGDVRVGGPLACGSEDCGAGGSIPVDVGKPVTTGYLVLQNRTNRPAVLDRLTLVGRPPQLNVVGVYAVRVGDNRYGGIPGLVRGFPPPGIGPKIRPLAGTIVSHSRTFKDAVIVLVGLRPTRKGSYAYDGLRLNYHVGKTRYVTSYAYAVRVCAPYMSVKNCPPAEPREAR